MNSVEEKLWDYIDGNCTPDEQAAIDALIAADEVYRQKYNELLAFNADMGRLELDQPPMNFTYNVMEAVRIESAAKPLKAAINKNVVRGLAGIFIAILASFIVYAFFSVNWSAGNGQQSIYPLPPMKIPVISKPAGSFILQAFVFVDTVLLLFFGDMYLRRQRAAKQL